MKVKKTLYLIPFIAVPLYMFVSYKLQQENKEEVNLSLIKRRKTEPGIIHSRRDCNKQKENYEKHKDELGIKDPAVWNDVEYMLFFVGLGRSGTSLVGALLDAHPNIVMPYEYNIGLKWKLFTEKQKNKRHLFNELYLASVKDATVGVKRPQVCLGIGAYSYHVANQWQGNFDRVIKVIGDKNADHVSGLIQNWKKNKEPDILSDIQEAVKIPFKYVFVVRNPFDVAATKLYRSNTQGVRASEREKLYQKPLKYDRNSQVALATHVAARITAARAFTQRTDVDAMVIYSEDIKKNPGKELKRLCKFLSVPCHDDYIKDCSNLVNATPSNTRHTMKWHNDAKNIIIKLIKEETILKRYSFDN